MKLRRRSLSKILQEVLHGRIILPSNRSYRDATVPEKNINKKKSSTIRLLSLHLPVREKKHDSNDPSLDVEEKTLIYW